MSFTSTGRVVYLHGLPGSVDEAYAALGTSSLPSHVLALDRLHASGDDADAALLSAFDGVVHEQSILIGFSLGAMSALNLAARRPNLVKRVVLVSPAAPLELGNFLPSMAGRAVFEAARRGRWPLSALSVAQAALTRWAPDALLNGMFHDCGAAELSLSTQPAFRRALLGSMRKCLLQHRAAYHRELLSFVKPWSATLGDVHCNVEIWHGDADTWAPIAMAEALKLKLAGQVSLRRCARLGHFSTLHHCLPDIMSAAVSSWDA